MVARSTIKKKVVNVLAAVSTVPAKDIKEPHKLKRDLGLSSAMRAALASPYTKISKHHGGSRITISEARNLKTVKASIDLVHKRANTPPKSKKKAKTKAKAKKRKRAKKI